MKFRESMVRVNPDNVEVKREQIGRQLSRKQKAESRKQKAESRKQKAEQEHLQAEYEADHLQPSLMDKTIAAEAYNNNPVRCRTHVVDSTLVMQDVEK